MNNPGRLYTYAVIMHEPDRTIVIRQPTAMWATSDDIVYQTALKTLPAEVQAKINQVEIKVRKF